MRFRHSFYSFAMMLCASFAGAQDLSVVGSTGILIPVGSLASPSYQTKFAKSQVGFEQTLNLRLYNEDPSTNLEISTVTVTGISAPHFQITQPSTTSVSPNFDFATMSIKFVPTTPGVKTATITIPNNTPGGKGNYTFTVSGEAVTGQLLAQPDLKVLVAPPQVSLNKKSGNLRLKGKVLVQNWSAFRINYGLIRLMVSEKPYVDLSSDLIQYKNLKNIGQYSIWNGLPGQRVVNFGFDTGSPNARFLVVMVESLAPFDGDAGWFDNVAVVPYGLLPD